MQIQLKTQAFRTEFDLVARHANGTKQPILGYVHCRTEDGAIVLRATAANHSQITTRMDCDVAGSAEFLLPAKRLGQILRECSDDTVSLECDDSHVKVTIGGSRFKLQTDPPNDYPAVGQRSVECKKRVPGGPLLRAMAHCVSVTDAESTRYALGAVVFEYRTDTLTLVATDTRQLVLRRLAADHQEGDELESVTQCKIGRVDCQMILGLIADAESVVLGLDLRHWSVEAGDRQASGVTVDGRFPAYAAVIPSRHAIHISDIMPDELARGCRLARVMSDKVHVAVALNFDREDGLKIRNESADVGSANVSVTCQAFSDVKTLFDVNALHGICAHFPGNVPISLRQANAETAMLCESEGVMHVIMPICRNDD